MKDQNVAGLDHRPGNHRRLPWPPSRRPVRPLVLLTYHHLRTEDPVPADTLERATPDSVVFRILRIGEVEDGDGVGLAAAAGGEFAAEVDGAVEGE